MEEREQSEQLQTLRAVPASIVTRHRCSESSIGEEIRGHRLHGNGHAS